MKRIAITFRELAEQTSVRPKEKSKNSSVKGIITRKRFRRFKFLVKSTESYSDPKGHIVSFMFPDEYLKEMYVRPRGKNPRNTKIKMWCTCPAWQYWGAAFNSTEQKYNLEKKEDRPPDIRDPDREYLMCKHTLAVLRNIQKATFPDLILRFAMGYLEKQLMSGGGTRIKKVKTSSVDGMASTADFEVTTIEETFPTIQHLLIGRGWAEADASDFVSNLTDDNYEDELLRVKLII